MSTLQSYTLTFNTNIKISADGGALSVDGGLPLVKEFMVKSNFYPLFAQTVQFKDDRKRLTHTRQSVFEQALLQKIAGYDTDDASDSLTHNQLFTQTLQKKQLASQPTMSRMFQSITPENIEEFNCLNQRYLDQYYGQESIDTVVIDLDSTHCDTFGKQEGSDFNNHYRTFGYHPLVAFDAVTGLFLKAQLRKGNVYTSTEVVPFLEPLLKHLIEDLNVSHILIRGDSGFAVPALYELCETYEVKYVIRLKANARLNQTAESFVFRNESYPIVELERQFDAFDYRANSWKKERTVVLQNERPAGKLLFTPLFIVTNMEGIIPEIIVKLYKNRGLMENFIKEAKLGFFMDKTDSSKFVINEARMWLGVLSYNIIQLMKSWVFPPSMKKWTIGTIRQRLIKVATKIVSHAGKIHFKLDETFVYLNDYFSVTKQLRSF